jgi:hypothetical protein
MTYRGHIQNGQITLDEPAELPDGAEANIEIIEKGLRIAQPQQRKPLQDIKPIELPGGPLSDDIIRDRR